MGPYTASKHAVVALSETLYHDLAARGSQVRVSVLCPGYVDTRIIDSARNRPVARRARSVSRVMDPANEARRAATREALRSVGREPDEVAACVIEAIRERRFYVLSHPERKDGIRVRMDAILHETEPRFVPLA
jgi:NAD(P)-dependent dehydrogenase (short-subunit alcohol dehydrogenase family)